MLPKNINDWLNARGISDKIIKDNKLDWNGTHIVIPILDANGKPLFNKYRRDPFNTDGPKYTYDTGGSVQLYNVHKVKIATKQVIICEGEFDALVLESHGYVAVTSTGGAGTFPDQWLPLFYDKDTIVCFDNDDAGYKGATKLLTKLPARLAVLPDYVGEHGDITDFFIQGKGSFDTIISQAETYPYLRPEPKDLTLIKDINEEIKRYNKIINSLVTTEARCSNAGKQWHHLPHIRQLLMNAVSNLERERQKIRYNKKPSTHPLNDGSLTFNDVKEAKRVPLTGLYKGKLTRSFNRYVGLCPYHNEKTGSFTIYTDQNKWYCYGCSTGGDVIDFVMKRDDCSFVQAVKTLLNK